MMQGGQLTYERVWMVRLMLAIRFDSKYPSFMERMTLWRTGSKEWPGDDILILFYE